MKYPESDFRIDVYRNAVQNAIPYVRITHMPSGFVATCADTRSEYQNKQHAMETLIDHLDRRSDEG